ncbi:hypothetical protein RND81_08G148500 [Saponaria officinalis]|uniref:Uncharacterized protein n=1 Tax=Saponaria officinalis TaxID=3572 RepID=A0AAW1J942_SAPOF
MCKALQMLNLSNNTLRGTIPSSILLLSKLEALVLSENQFEGPIDAGFKRLEALNSLVLRGNSLSEHIPPFLGNCLKLQLVTFKR